MGEGDDVVFSRLEKKYLCFKSPYVHPILAIFSLLLAILFAFLLHYHSAVWFAPQFSKFIFFKNETLFYQFYDNPHLSSSLTKTMRNFLICFFFLPFVKSTNFQIKFFGTLCVTNCTQCFFYPKIKIILHLVINCLSY